MINAKAALKEVLSKLTDPDLEVLLESFNSIPDDEFCEIIVDATKGKRYVITATNYEDGSGRFCIDKVIYTSKEEGLANVEKLKPIYYYPELEEYCKECHMVGASCTCAEREDD